MSILLLMSLVISADVFAEENTTQLNEVVVTATRTEKELQDVTQSVSVITNDEIMKTGATDVATAIHNVIGVHIAGYGTPGSVSSLNIRGASSSQILVLLNGIRMNSSRDGGFDLSLLPVSVAEIERIEIVRGPASALYGSDAVGGVVNIITKKPTGNQSMIRSAIGSHGYDDLFLKNAGRDNAWYYSLAGEREISNGYRTNSDLKQWTFGGRLGYDLSNSSSIELSANYLENKVGTPGSLIYGITPNARQQERNTITGIAYNGKLASTLELKLSGYRKLDDLSLQDPDSVDMMTFLPAPTNDKYETKSDGGAAQLSWLIASWNQLTAGCELKHDHLDSYDAQNGTSSHAATLKAYYLQDEISIGESFIVNVGGRHDEYSVFGGKFSPKASARYFIRSTGTIFRASYGESFRAPTFNDLYFNTTWAIGNPNLRPESAREGEVGIEQKLGNDAVLKFTGFDRRVKDLIEWDWSVFPMQVNNIGKVRIKGLEAEASYRMTEMIDFLVNYTYTNPVDQLTGQNIYYTIPKSETKGVITLFLEKSVYLTLDGRAVENYVKPGEGKWRYSVFDAKIAETYGKGTEFFIAVNNLFKRQYEAVQGYPMPPQEFRVGISVQF